MVGRLVLVALQVALGWLGTPAAQRLAIAGAQYQPLVNGVVAGAIVWVTGLVGAQFLKDVSSPSTRKLGWAIVGGLIGGLVVAFQLLQGTGLKPPPPLAMVLFPAILGYHVAR